MKPWHRLACTKCGQTFHTGLLRLYVMSSKGACFCPVCANGEDVDKVLAVIARSSKFKDMQKDSWRN